LGFAAALALTLLRLILSRLLDPPDAAAEDDDAADPFETFEAVL
jgi:hypothetical protein